MTTQKTSFRLENYSKADIKKLADVLGYKNSSEFIKGAIETFCAKYTDTGYRVAIHFDSFQKSKLEDLIINSGNAETKENIKAKDMINVVGNASIIMINEFYVEAQRQKIMLDSVTDTMRRTVAKARYAGPNDPYSLITAITYQEPLKGRHNVDGSNREERITFRSSPEFRNYMETIIDDWNFKDLSDLINQSIDYFNKHGAALRDSKFTVSITFDKEKIKALEGNSYVRAPEMDELVNCQLPKYIETQTEVMKTKI